MAIKISTADANATLSRSTTLPWNSAYTVMFRFYLPAQNASTSYLLNLVGSNSNHYERLILKTNGGLWFQGWDGTDSADIDTGSLYPQAGWHTAGITRSAANSVYFYYDGSLYGPSTADMTGRSTIATEKMIDGCAANAAVTNYKSWSRALSAAEMDAEDLDTAYIVSTNSFSKSAMGDEATLAGNLTADGSGNTWSAGSSMTYGTNDPSVTYVSAATGVPKSTKFLMMGIG